MATTLKISQDDFRQACRRAQQRLAEIAAHTSYAEAAKLASVDDYPNQVGGRGANKKKQKQRATAPAC